MLTSIITSIKALSVGAKIVITTIAVVVVGGVTTTTIILINQSQPEEAAIIQPTQEEITEEVEIPFEEIEEKDNSLEEGKTKIKQEGKNGTKVITYLITFDADHNEVNREKISEEMITEPQNEITVIGTRKQITQSAPSDTPVTKPITNTAPVANAKNICDPKKVGVECELDYSVAYQSRANYGAVGGWEKAIQDLYRSYLVDLREYGNDFYIKGIESSATGHQYINQQHLCYTSLSLDVGPMKIINASWDDQPTSTCDNVRGEYPPVPSLEYLNSYLQRLLMADCYVGGLGELVCRRSLF